MTKGPAGTLRSVFGAAFGLSMASSDLLFGFVWGRLCLLRGLEAAGPVIVLVALGVGML